MPLSKPAHHSLPRIVHEPISATSDLAHMPYPCSKSETRQVVRAVDVRKISGTAAIVLREDLGGSGLKVRTFLASG